mgnify:CR=1 FL=1
MDKTLTPLITKHLSEDEALVLQQIYEDDEADARLLALQLGMGRGHLMQAIASLRRKHLIDIQRSYEGVWIRISSQGRRLMRYIWPEAALV